MSDKRFYQEKSAYLTALISALVTAQRICETLDRHEESSPAGANPDFIAIKEMINDTIAATEGLRSTVDKRA